MTTGYLPDGAPHDFLAGLPPHLRRQANELAAGVLEVAEQGGDVDAWIRDWVERNQALSRRVPDGSRER